MRIALCQIDCVPGDTDTNTSRVLETIARAADNGARAAILPELCDTGYDMETVKKTAGDWERGPCGAIRRCALENSIGVICGLSERAGDRIYDSLAVIDAAGALKTTYRKVHLFRAGTVDESAAFSAGDRLVDAEVDGLRAGMLICYDLRFPEQSRGLVTAGAQLLVVSAAWPAARIDHWSGLLRARAVENQCYVAGVNRCGTDGSLELGGTSQGIDPWGTVLAQAPPAGEKILLVDLDPAAVQETRRRIPALNHRRTDLY